MGGGGKDKNDLNIHVEEGGGLKWLGTEREYNPGCRGGNVDCGRFFCAKATSSLRESRVRILGGNSADFPEKDKRKKKKGHTCSPPCDNL